MTTPKQPATGGEMGPMDWTWPLERPTTEASLLALREAATAAYNALRSVPSADMPDALLNVEKWLDKALAAPAAAEIEARIEQRVTDALYAMGFDIDDEVLDRLHATLHREQPAAEIKARIIAKWLNSPAPAVLMADANLPEAEIMRALRALRREQ